MLGTGLRSRFFLIIFAVLSIVSIAAVGIYSNMLKQERMVLIDQQVRDTAAALVDSELGGLRRINFEKADDIISDELGESSIGKFFIIRNTNGKVLFQSASASLLPIREFPTNQQWFDLSTKDRHIRGLNLKLPRIPDRTLQVGLVLDDKIIDPYYFSKISLAFIVVLVLLGLITSLFLTSFLVKPISNLEQFVSEVKQATLKQSVLPNIPIKLFPNRSPNSKDEFERLLSGLDALISRINRNYQFSRIWAYQMAHELKTPLSFLNLEIENLKAMQHLSESQANGLNIEVKHISDTINSFLGWAELENSAQQRHLFLNRLGAVTERITKSIPMHKNRIYLTISNDLIVVSNPQHLEQLLLNLVLNALNYSGDTCPITVTLTKNTLTIEDQGPGISAEVLNRLGEPFNRGAISGQIKKGHGLGLAWVKSICRLYDWEISFLSKKSGTKVTITFPAEEAYYSQAKEKTPTFERFQTT